MDAMRPDVARRLRGHILMLLRARHNLQKSRMDDVELTSALQSLGYSLLTQDVVTLVQDLGDRKFVRYIQRRNWLTNRVCLERIELTSSGRDQAEENLPTDPSVEFSQ